MKIYIDFSKQAITKIDSDVAYVGDVYSNVFELLFFNYGDNADWFPTMSQLAPNGREAGDFSADALEEDETYDYVEDDITYKRYTFTIGDGWVRMKGRSNFFVWVNKLVDTNALQRKCYGKVMVTLNESTDNYFIQDAYLNPKVKEYIDNTIGDDLETYKSTIDDEVEAQNEAIEEQDAKIDDVEKRGGTPNVATSTTILAYTENKGIWVGSDNNKWYYWNGTQYVEGGTYQAVSIADGSIGEIKLADIVIDKFKLFKDSFGTGKNLFNPDMIIKGKNIDSNGAILDNASFDISYPVPIKNGETIYFSVNGTANNTLMAFSTSDIISNTSYNWTRFTANSYTATADGYIIMRINSGADVSKYQLEIGTGVTTFEKFYYDFEHYNKSVLSKGFITNTSLTDADNITDSGIYFLNSAITNIPNSQQGLLLVFNYALDSLTNVLCQVFFRYTGTMYSRIKWNTWTTWKELSFKETTIKYDYLSMSLFEKVGIVGDSFASGEIYIQTDTNYNYTDGNGNHYYMQDYYNLSWGQILARKLGFTAINFSKGGLSTRTWLTAPKGLTLLLNSPQQQLYICALGLNDIKEGTEYIGSISDINDNDYTQNADTFYGNYGKIIQQIKVYAPNAKIILSTMANNTNATYIAFNTAIESIASHFGCAMIRQYEDEFFTSPLYLNNMVASHPTSLGYSGMAKALQRLIEKYMQEHPSFLLTYVG